MTGNIKTWGCSQRSQNKKFATGKDGKPIVRITTEMECRYDNVVNEEEINQEEEMEIELEEEGDIEPEEPILNETKTIAIQQSSPSRTSTADNEMEMIRNAFKRFLG